MNGGASYAEQKKAARAEFRLKLAGVSKEVREQESRHLSEILAAWLRTKDYEVLLATLPLADEPDLCALLEQWLKGGGALGLAATGAGGVLTFGYVPSLDGPWVTRPGGLREPSDDRTRWQPGPKTLCLVPGLAFAELGSEGFARLGRGGGYFDRWLAHNGNAVTTLGVGFSVQWSEALPVEAHDRPLNSLVLPRGFVTA